MPLVVASHSQQCQLITGNTIAITRICSKDGVGSVGKPDQAGISLVSKKRPRERPFSIYWIFVNASRGSSHSVHSIRSVSGAGVAEPPWGWTQSPELI